ncbi:YaaL family protein [Shouchella lonarensis]|uniref:Uncharacterized protein n=1 Tax=Shouchella lonarensis TaxID=1464122 RepID=A0A1G6NX87_9BACI|nr:YaaL family protein [Shouchella lonarensis]SDC72562.1 Protein of unknown function [Shouchella lonarensis]
MLQFKKRGRLRKEEDERLLEHMDMLKQMLDYKRGILAHSVVIPEEVCMQKKRDEALYSMLLREARTRHQRVEGSPDC